MTAIYSGINPISGGSSLSQEEKDKVAKVKIDGDGTKVLADNGEYVELSSSNIDIKIWSTTSTETYKVNDLVSFENQLYQCVTENSDRDSFDFTKYISISAITFIDKVDYDALTLTDTDRTLFIVNDNGKYSLYSGKICVSNGNGVEIDDDNPSLTTTYSASKIESDFLGQNDLDDAKLEIENSVKADFFSKTEAQDYINSKLDLKVDKVTGYGLSKNNFTDAYKDTLDNLDLDDVVRDPLYCRTDNNFTNVYKQKLDNLTNDSKYIGLFDTKAELDAYNTDLTTGLWGSVLADETQGNKKTKYIYDGTQFVFAGLYSDDAFLIDDSATDSESLGWSSKKLTTELDKKANKLDVDTSIDEINDKLDKKLEITNLKAGNNISIDVDQYGNATFNSTASGSSTTGGTTDYELLSNKPRINNVTVMGDKTSKDLGLLDISYASDVNENSVKMADKAKEIDIEGQLDGKAKYYGVASGGTDEDNTVKLRPFPVGLATERIETLDFAILTKDVPQSIPFARKIPTVNCFVQAFKQEESELNITDIFEDYNNELVSNHSENVICNENGLSIKDEYKINNNGINSDGLYEIKIGKFVDINNIKSEVNK